MSTDDRLRHTIETADRILLEAEIDRRWKEHHERQARDDAEAFGRVMAGNYDRHPDPIVRELVGAIRHLSRAKP